MWPAPAHDPPQPGPHRKPAERAGRAGRAIVGLTCENERGEAAQVIRWLEQAAQEREQPWNECAVMYSTHRNGRHFEEECVRQQVPYRVVGGPRFYDRAEIRDCLAYLRLVHNPGDDVALQRIINRPASRCGLALDMTDHHPGRPGRRRARGPQRSETHGEHGWPDPGVWKTRPRSGGPTGAPGDAMEGPELSPGRYCH